METMLDIFTTLNCAIDAGVMTQEALTIAIAAIIQRARDEHEGQTLPLEWTLRLSEEVEGLKGHWNAYCAAQTPPSVG